MTDENFDESYDDKLAAWSDGQKYIDARQHGFLNQSPAPKPAIQTRSSAPGQTLDAAIALI